MTSQVSPGGFGGFVVRLRWLWLVLGLALTVAAGLGLPKITFDPDARIFFADENPDRIALDAFEAEFAKDDNILIVMTPKGGAVFTPAVLKAVGATTEAAWLLPAVRKVDSVTNFQHTYAEGDEMIVRDLAPDPAAVTQAEADAARAIALSRPELVNALIDPAASLTAVQVMFRMPAENPPIVQIVEEVEALTAQIEADYPFIDIALTGSVALNNQFNTSAEADGTSLTPLMFGAILLIVGLAFRSVVAALLTTVIIAMSAIVGMGALGHSGVPLNSVTVLAPLIIMTLAVAAVVHILSSVRQTMVETPDRKIWAAHALNEHAGEIAIACLTTVIGFLALNFSISPPFRELGNVVAVGIAATLFLSLTFLPALITIAPLARKTAPATTDGWMRPLAEFVISWRKALLVVMGAIVLVLAAGVPRLALEDDFVRYFDDRYEFRTDTDYFEANLGGLNALEFAVPAGGSDGINDPDYLRKVEAFADWLRAQPDVRYVRTLTDTLKRLNMNMNADDPAKFHLPETDQETAQFLFLYELSLGYGMDLTDSINIDRSALRVSATMAQVTTSDMRALTAEAGRWFDENAPELKVTPTGLTHVFNQISYRDVRAMLTGTVLALIGISLLMLLILRDVKLGLLSLIPNLVPAAMAFGVWGYTVGAVTLAIAVVIAMTLGIVVDDTVHFLSKYKEGRRKGMSPEDSVRNAFGKVGMALLVTTAALVTGFVILAQSGFAVNGDMAKLTALTITLALVLDFLLLPALLITLDKTTGDDMTTSPTTGGFKAATIAALAAIGLAATTSPAQAMTPEEKGLDIALRADASDKGWGDFTNEGEMILRDTNGNENRRIWSGMTLERGSPADGDWSVIVFSSPRDIEGTATLTHSKVEPADDDQWLYLPAVKRVKRISSSNRTGKFVGSEFSFEDLGSQEVADYTYKWLRDEPCPGTASLTCHVVESYPKNARSGYSKRISWADVDEFRQFRVEFFNRRGDLEKVLTAEGFNEYAGQFWRADRLLMENKQTGKSTELLQSNYQFGTGLDEGDFNAQRLPRLSR